MEVVRSVERESEKRFGTPSHVKPPQLQPLWKSKIEDDLFEFSESVLLAEELELGPGRNLNRRVDMWNETGFLEDIGVHGWADIGPDTSLPLAAEESQQQLPVVRTPSGMSSEETPQSRTPTRYTEIEVKALVHAKLRLQMLNSFGENSTKSEENCLRNLYLHYLQLLDRNGHEAYPPREGSALLRKFKSLKSKGTQLVEYFDGTLDNGLWLHMKKLITEPVRVTKRKAESSGRQSKQKRKRNGTDVFNPKIEEDSDVL